MISKVKPIELLILFFLVLTTHSSPSATDQHNKLDWDAFREKQRTALNSVDKPQSLPEDYNGHPIDWFLERWYEKNEIEPGEVCNDAVFLRRAYLQTVGLLPTIDEFNGFIQDRSPQKREKLIGRLLNDRQAYAEHWITFWSDLLRNDEQTNIDGLREPITKWLYSSLLSNKPFDIMVMQLLNPAPDGPEGFLKGVNWRGRINASQRPVIQAAQNIGQVFMATSLKCASCHNHFLKPYTLKDTYGLAACFSEENQLDIYRCDKPTGEVAKPEFPFDGLGKIDDDATLYTRRGQAAEMVVTPKNPRFARTIVNRLWHRLLGRGLFEPVDDLDSQAHYAELLDWLAYDFMKHGYDLKHTLRLIMTSKVFQHKATVSHTASSSTPEYKAPTIQRMQSEQFFDGIYQITGYVPDRELMNVNVDNHLVRSWRTKYPSLTAIALGRPNREQVTSVRNHEATVLQMLEMVNGEQFALLLGNAAEHMLESHSNNIKDVNRFVQKLVLRTFSRHPTQHEVNLLTQLLRPSSKAKEIKPEALEDVLWMLFMSPDYQYIH